MIEHKESADEKVVVIGWDGATFDVLRPMIQAGVMPALARMMSGSAHGVLFTTRPPVTCPAWPTMFTGVNPGKHGVFSFSFRDPNTGRMRTASGCDVDAPKIWDLLSEAGRRAAVLNVPITYPASIENGIMLSGFVSPDDSPRVLCPESLNGEFRREFDPLLLNWDVLSHRPADPRARERHIDTINNYLAIRNRQFEYLLDRGEFDFCFLVHEYTDRVQHLFYHLLDPRFSAYSAAENRRSVELLRDGFRELDRNLQWLLERFGPEANYMLVSDHGFGGVNQWVYINNLLEQHGLLRIKPAKCWADAITRRLNFSDGTRSRLGLHPREPWHRQDPFCGPLIDYSRSMAFAGPQLEHSVYINVRGRCPDGIVEPGRQYDSIRGEVIDLMRAARDPQTGEAVFEGVWPREELYAGPRCHEAPDVIYELAPGYMVPNYPLPPGMMKGRFLRALRPGWDISGYHRPQGVLIAAGPAFRPVSDGDFSINDVAPTALYLMGQPIPEYMDGKVMVKALRPELLDQRPPTSGERACRGAALAGAYTASEQAEVTRRLEELGYL